MAHRRNGVAAGNLLADLPSALADEEVATLAASGHMRLDRIVSTGQASPEGVWYDQAEAEWVVVLRGRARLRFEGEDADREFGPGDYVHIPAHARHRVAWTAPDTPTVWLALHYQP